MVQGAVCIELSELTGLPLGVLALVTALKGQLQSKPDKDVGAQFL